MDRAKIQLAVAKVTVFETAVGDEGHVTSAQNQVTGNPFPYSNGLTSNYQAFLEDFGTAGGKTPLEHDKFCLAHAFTAADFDDGVLGLAWLGTVCQASGSNSRNTGMSTDYNFGKKVSYTQAMLVVTHEVGHNFGMEHDTKCNRFCNDDDYPEHAAKCEVGNDGMEISGNNKFIMWPTSVDGKDSNNNVFSECSRYLAALRLAGIYDQMSCLTDTDPTNVCGNGIVYGEEECDCGTSMPADLDIDEIDSWTDAQKLEYDQLVEACQEEDPCCLPTCQLDRPASAGFRTGDAECSPVKDSYCCGAKGADDQCKMRGVEPDEVAPGTLTPFEQFLPSSYLDVLYNDRVNFGADGSEYDATKAIKCSDGSECSEPAWCIKDAKYTGICPSKAVKLIGESEEPLFKPDGKLCDFEAADPLDLDSEEIPRRTCSRGECQGSLCAAFTSDESADPTFIPTACELDGANNTNLYCEVACIFVEGGQCTSTKSLLEEGSLLAYLSPVDGNINNQGELFPTTNLKPTGVNCNSYKGLCQADGRCQGALSVMPLDLLADFFTKDWVWENWYVVLGIETVIAGIAFLMRCTNGDHTKEKKAHVKQFVRTKLARVREQFLFVFGVVLGLVFLNYCFLFFLGGVTCLLGLHVYSFRFFHGELLVV